MRRVAIKWDQVTIDADGHIAGHDAGATLVRRLVRLTHNPIVIGPATRRCDGFDEMPLAFLDTDACVVINMDVLDSTKIWRVLRENGSHPAVMNFQWGPTTNYDEQVPQLIEALSFALFPTFANSERKRPRLFVEVVEKVHRKVPIRVAMRLHESHLVSELGMALSGKDWFWVGPLTATRVSYWEALASTTAFLATATEESYGLEYVEALAAGVIGVLPDTTWARALVPEGYPFLWKDAAQAEAMLLRAVSDPDGCRAELDAIAGGDFAGWIANKHNDDDFEQAMLARLQEWF